MDWLNDSTSKITLVSGLSRPVITACDTNTTGHTVFSLSTVDSVAMRENLM